MSKIGDKFIFVFVSPKEIEFMKMFFVINHSTTFFREEKRYTVSGGDCNPIIYPDNNGEEP